MRRYGLAACLVLGLASTVAAEQYRCQSPQGDVEIVVDVQQAVTWSVRCAGVDVLKDCQLGLELEGQSLPGEAPKVVRSQQADVRERVRPTVPTKSLELDNRATQITLFFDRGCGIQFRAYDNAATYRFLLGLTGDVEIKSELLELRFCEECDTFFPREESLYSHFERDYLRPQLSEIGPDQFCSLPVLLRTESGVYVAVTDADLFDYPALFLEGTGGLALRGKFPPAVWKAQPADDGPDRNETLVELAPYIAKTTGKRQLPWRVIMLAKHMRSLVEDDLVFKLSRPLQLEDTDWIQPGKVAWDWWNALNLYGVDFPAGINTQTYKYYIDFAAQYDLQYIILDEGWSKTTTNLLETKQDVDVAELVRYGREKNVGVILWTLWKPLDQDMQQILDLWASWGVKGIKVDFMQRADQQMVNFYMHAAREAAKRKLLVDFHGAFKPAGLRRAYPNVINYEGLRGLENCKWCDAITPTHDVTLPFVRMLAGPMDYTPGAMDNAQPDNFFARFTRPMSQGTRCHQIAMYVLYDAPLQMLSDTPSNYLREPDCTRFIAGIPTTWHETKLLEGEPGQYLLMARRHDDKWYVAAMTNEQPRDLELPLSLLKSGTWQLQYACDGVNAQQVAIDHQLGTRSVTPSDTLTIHLAKGGGWAGVLSPSK